MRTKYHVLCTENMFCVRKTMFCVRKTSFVYGKQCFVYGKLIFVYGKQCFVYGILCFVYGKLCFVYRKYCFVYGKHISKHDTHSWNKPTYCGSSGSNIVNNIKTCIIQWTFQTNVFSKVFHHYFKLFKEYCLYWNEYSKECKNVLSGFAVRAGTETLNPLKPKSLGKPSLSEHWDDSK